MFVTYTKLVSNRVIVQLREDNKVVPGYDFSVEADNRREWEKLTKDEKDKGAFKTPTVRNVAMTAPYMHDGSQKTLEEVVEWYAKGGHPNPHLSDKIKKLDLTAQDKKDLVEYMKSL